MKKNILLLAALCLIGLSHAAITDQLDSSSFDYKFEGDTASPTGYTPANDASGTTDGDVFTFLSDPYKYYTSNDWATAAAEATGWTYEIRFKVGTDNPSDYHIQIDIYSADDDTTGAKQLIRIGPSEIYIYGKGTMSTVDMTDDFHTLRIAQEPNTATCEYWLDGVYQTGYTGSLSTTDSTLQWGALSGSVVGTIYIDYIRFTGSGAYAPGAANPKPTNPSPADTAADVAVDTILGWDNVPDASSHDVYLGTDATAVANADRNSPLYKGNILTTDTNPDSYDPAGLAYETTYYWRIDGVDSSDTVQWPGDVWSFTTVDTPITNPTNPSPADGSVDVDVNTTLSWTNGELASSHDIYIGTDLTEVANADRTSSLYKGNKPTSESSVYDPELGYGATYYWRIDAVNDSDVPEWPGDVWSFTTGKTSFDIVGDLNGNHKVDEVDLMLFSEQWLNGPGCPTADCADFNGVDGVNMVDYALMAENWQIDAPPVITLLGDAVVSVNLGETYIDAGATAYDAVDGDLTSSIVVNNPVDTGVAGTYTVTYNVTDSAGNAAEEVTRTVTVIEDTTPPVITLIGDSEVTVTLNSVYNDAGATAQDDVDGDITSQIVTVNPVDTSVAGTYTVTYNVTDSAGNPADEVTRTVNVTALATVDLQNDFDDAADNYDPTSSSSPIHKYASNLSSSQITFNHFGADTDTPTGTGKSFYIDADIHDVSGSWYYYFALPLPLGTTNLHGTLAASFDIKMNSSAADATTISADVYGYPIQGKVIIGNGIASEDADTWQHISLRDLARNFKVDAPYTFVGYRLDSPYYFLGEACDIKMSDIGVKLSCLMIRVLASGPQNIRIRVDNYSLTGTQMNQSDWYYTYLDSYTYPAWHAYHDRVDGLLDAREAELNALEALPTLPASPSNKQQYQFDKLTYYKNTIASNISQMRTDNAYRTGSGSWTTNTLIRQTDDYLARYKATIGYLKRSITSPPSDFDVYEVPAMKFGYLDGYTFPAEYDELTSYSLRMARGEYTSIAMLLDPAPGYSATLTFENTDFTDGVNSFAADNLDKYVAKIWYQAGRYETRKVAGGAHFLTQELLLKNENLVRVTHDASENSGPASGENDLWVTDNDGTNGRYVNISTVSSIKDPTFPDPRTITFNDSSTLQPFVLNDTYKILWSIVHVPEGTPEGTYTSTLKIKQGATVVKTIPLTVEVLPFDLAGSRVAYGLYYHGKLRADMPDSSITPLSCHEKTHAQQQIELQDMFDHGVYYPGHYEDDIRVLDDTLAIQNSIGFPQDRFYSLGLLVRTYTTLSDVTSWQDVLSDYGYDPHGLHMYGYDEASGPALASLIQITEDVVYAAGAKVFCAIYSDAFDHVGNYMDVAIYGYGTHAPGIDKQIADWHSADQEIFSYSDPQVGVENPEIYRRDYGIRMYQMGFDGAFDYAYQKEYGVFWNDFDTKTSESARREEAFTYPTTNGIVGTVQWEGYRTAINDVRYLSTLLDIRDQLAAEGHDVTELDNWIANLNTDSDLDALRDSIVDKILSLYP